MIKPAIVAVGYNRPHSLLRLLTSIELAEYEEDDITLIISLDKSDVEENVLKVANDFRWTHGEKIIRRTSKRLGLRKHILNCGDLSIKYGAVIILEDDLVVSPAFYTYTVRAVDFYKNEQNITGIALYSHEWNGYARKNFFPIVDEYDTYLGQFSITWGQCWTAKWWTSFKEWYSLHMDKLVWNDAIPSNINKWSDQSWGKYFVNYITEKKLFYVIPRVSLTTNCSDVGQHVIIPDNIHQVRIMYSNKSNYFFAPAEKAKKYDIFFESFDIVNYFDDDIKEQGLTVDLAGFGRKQNGKYLLTTLKYPFHVVNSFGLQMRPYEMNVIADIPGEDIFLYDTSVPESNKRHDMNAVMRYELRGFSIRDLSPYYFSLLRDFLFRHTIGKLKK